MKWIKDNGQEIETNELKETIDKCIQLGWKHKTEEEPKKRGRPAKKEEE